MNIEYTRSYIKYTVAKTVVAMVDRNERTVRISIRPQMIGLSVKVINDALAHLNKRERLITSSGSVVLLNSNKQFTNGMVI